jgi:peptidoglycan/xylan/chitin deacetylase (PgdA/CDA1 family)
MRLVLTFHSLDECPSPLCFPSGLLHELLGELAAASLPVLDLDELLLPTTRRGVAITFDDGMRSVLTRGLPCLREHAAPAHLFLTTGAVGSDNGWPSQPADTPRFEMLHWTEIEQLHREGVRIDAHTASHPDLLTLEPDEIEDELEQSNLEIERRLGRKPRYFAYPYGRHDARVRRIAQRHYAACLTTELRAARMPLDLAAVPRVDSYYLRMPAIRRNLASRSVAFYLGLRRMIRRARGMS